MKNPTSVRMRILQNSIRAFLFLNIVRTEAFHSNSSGGGNRRSDYAERNRDRSDRWSCDDKKHSTASASTKSPQISWGNFAPSFGRTTDNPSSTQASSSATAPSLNNAASPVDQPTPTQAWSSTSTQHQEKDQLAEQKQFALKVTTLLHEKAAQHLNYAEERAAQARVDMTLMEKMKGPIAPGSPREKLLADMSKMDENLLKLGNLHTELLKEKLDLTYLNGPAKDPELVQVNDHAIQASKLTDEIVWQAEAVTYRSSQIAEARGKKGEWAVVRDTILDDKFVQKGTKVIRDHGATRFGVIMDCNAESYNELHQREHELNQKYAKDFSSQTPEEYAQANPDSAYAKEQCAIHEERAEWEKEVGYIKSKASKQVLKDYGEHQKFTDDTLARWTKDCYEQLEKRKAQSSDTPAETAA